MASVICSQGCATRQADPSGDKTITALHAVTEGRQKPRPFVRAGFTCCIIASGRLKTCPTTCVI